MNNWINANIRLPELHKINNMWLESDSFPVIVDGVKGWHKAFLYSSLDGDFVEWKIQGFNGVYVVTHWYELKPPKISSFKDFKEFCERTEEHKHHTDILTKVQEETCLKCAEAWLEYYKNNNKLTAHQIKNLVNRIEYQTILKAGK